MIARRMMTPMLITHGAATMGAVKASPRLAFAITLRMMASKILPTMTPTKPSQKSRQ